MNPDYSTSSTDVESAEIGMSTSKARTRHPANLFEFYKRINTPQRLTHMIKKFKLQDYIGVEEYEALSYFDTEQIPEEKAMLRPVRRAVLAMLADIPIKRRKNSLHQVFKDKQGKN